MFEKRLGEKTGSDLSRMDTAGSSDAENSPGRRRSDDLTALPILKELDSSPHLRPINRGYDAGIPYDFKLLRESSHSPTMPPGTGTGIGSKIQRVGSNKRGAAGSVGRKLSKRRKDDNRIREEEIRAMSQSHPQEFYPSKTGSILRKDSRKVKSGLIKHSERPSSTISLPLAESIHSSMSSDSGNHAFTINAFHVFAPRPSFRLSASPVGSGGLQHSKWAPSPEPHRDGWRVQSIPLATEEILAASRTIDNLADDMDAGALRDMLERDARRQEKKRRLQQERLLEKLERRAERQRLREQREQQIADAVTAGLGIATEPSSSMQGIQTTDTAQRPTTEHVGTQLTSSQKQKAPYQPRNATPHSFLEDASPMHAPKPEDASIETPLETPQEEPIVELAKAIRYSQPNLSPPASPVDRELGRDGSSQPQRMELSEVRVPEPPAPLEPSSSLQPSVSIQIERNISTTTPDPQPSETSSRAWRKGSGWTAFFRRGTNMARRFSGSRRSTPSEASFSNTSRESMARQPLPPHLQHQPVRARSTPHRTLSKFREDLPELPLSPPDSRVQSPEVTNARAAAATGSYPEHGPETGRSSVSPAFDDRSGRSVSPIVRTGHESALMSSSLASVDSEASWLSGKPSKRISPRNRGQSIGSGKYIRPTTEGDFSASYEELGIPDEEYFQRLTPRAAEQAEVHVANDPFSRKTSSAAAAYPLLEEGGAADIKALPEGAVVHDSIQRHPTVVHREATHVKSREGLLNDFISDDLTPTNSFLDEPTPEAKPTEIDDGVESDLPPSPQSMFRYQRAKSVDLGKTHVRHLSAGSAKLLDIVPSRRSSRRESSQSPQSPSSSTVLPSAEGVLESEAEAGPSERQ